MTGIPIVRPQFPALADFASDFSEALASGHVTNGGRWVREFEAALTNHLGIPTLVFSSGQSALMTMLRAADVAGGEVICPSFTFAGTPAAVVWADATPVFADIDPQTLCLDLEHATGLMTSQTSGFLSVAPYGIYPKVLSPQYLPFLVDAAPAFGTKHNESRPTAQIFSFHATKPFSTMEGGAIASHDGGFLARCERIRNFGQRSDGGVTEIGLNGKMMEVCALMGLRQLDDWPRVLAERQGAAMMLRDALADIDGLTVIGNPPGQNGVWTYQPALVDESRWGQSRDNIVKKMAQAGVVARTYYTACHRLDAFKQYATCELPVTDRVARQVIAMPVLPNMTAQEIDRIAHTMRAIRGME